MLPSTHTGNLVPIISSSIGGVVGLGTLVLIIIIVIVIILRRQQRGNCYQLVCCGLLIATCSVTKQHLGHCW